MLLIYIEKIIHRYAIDDLYTFFGFRPQVSLTKQSYIDKYLEKKKSLEPSKKAILNSDNLTKDCDPGRLVSAIAKVNMHINLTKDCKV